MVRITVPQYHPITVVAADEPRYYFAQLIATCANTMQLRLRRPVPSVASLQIRSVIIEALGPIAIRIGCRNISTPQDYLVRVELPNPVSLDIVFLPSSEDDLPAESSA